jgi:FkbM family methyltransferase
MKSLKHPVKRMINAAGFELRRLKPKTNPAYQLLLGLKHFSVDLVFDIGANTGRFASELREVGYTGRIVSFEPLSDASRILRQRAAKDANWQVHEACAVGDFDGEIDINVSGNSVSSSILPMTEAHSSAAKNSAYIGSERVPIYRLDSIAEHYLAETNGYFLKIDTQGFEWQVLDGASETLAGAQGLLCELSLLPLYEGQRLWLEMIQRLEQQGFTLWSIQKGFTDIRDGRTLQIDASFFRLSNRGN